METLTRWLATLRRCGQKLGPYLMLEIVVPGGTLAGAAALPVSAQEDVEPPANFGLHRMTRGLPRHAGTRLPKRAAARLVSVNGSLTART